MIAGRSAGEIRRMVWRWGPAIGWLGLMTYLSHQPDVPIPTGSTDWFLHAIEFGILALLLSRAVGGPGKRLGPARAAGILGACAVTGVLDEFHQSFVPGRMASAADVGWDIAGAAAALVALLLAGSTMRSSKGSELDLTLLSRDGCHLCDEAERVLLEILPEFGARFRKRDIGQDAALGRLYGDQIPVLFVNGRKAFKHRIDPERLRRKLLSLQGRGRT